MQLHLYADYTYMLNLSRGHEQVKTKPSNASLPFHGLGGHIYLSFILKLCYTMGTGVLNCHSRRGSFSAGYLRKSSKKSAKDIPGIVETQAGENRSPNNQGYTYGFVMHFVDAEHLKAYAPHPAHQIVSKELQAMCDSIIDFDIE
jgi:hypothetical protein